MIHIVSHYYSSFTVTHILKCLNLMLDIHPSHTQSTNIYFYGQTSTEQIIANLQSAISMITQCRFSVLLT